MYIFELVSSILTLRDFDKMYNKLKLYTQFFHHNPTFKTEQFKLHYVKPYWCIGIQKWMCF